MPSEVNMAILVYIADQKGLMTYHLSRIDTIFRFVVGKHRFWSLALRFYPAFIRKCFIGTIAHMRHGKDTNDALSVGGWDQNELHQFLFAAIQLGYNLPGERNEA